MKEIRDYSKVGDFVRVPELVQIQTTSYEDFLQPDTPPNKRKSKGLETVLRETFPIKSYDETMSLEYVNYRLGRARYGPEECRRLRLTYGMPLHVRLRLDKEEPVEEEVYLGDVPIMLGGGEFIINGSERVVVTQLHRSPGVDFDQQVNATGKRLHSCRIIPERGSWIEIGVSKRDVLHVRLDQSGKFPATMLLRAMSPRYGTDEEILRLFYQTEKVKITPRMSASKLADRVAVGGLVNNETGEVLVESGQTIPEDLVDAIKKSSLKEIEVIASLDDPLILNTVKEDLSDSYESALTRIYRRLRPGNPPQLEKAKQLFEERFFDTNRYRLGKVGRFRLNRKFNQDISENEMTLREEDYVNALQYVLGLRAGQGQIDDIDHLGNRRIRTIDELAGEEIRKGFFKLKRTAQERMNLKDQSELSPRSLINSRTISTAIDYFFARSELSNVVDQVNPLAQLTHERRLSALGPGGLNRKRAGFEVRDVHTSHYGRICPIETPEGTNIGLITYLSLFASVDDYGFLCTPYREVKDGRVTENLVYLRGDEENEAQIAPATIKFDDKGKIEGEMVLARTGGEFKLVAATELDYVDVSPKQLVGVSASLIPFLEHDDANRALMGSNMQRQAVPLLQTEAPLIATGVESSVARNSGMVCVARNDGTVNRVTADFVEIDGDKHELRKFVGLSSRTCLNQRPIVKEDQQVTKGQVIADGASTCEGELALGRNVLVAFMPWEGYNFEDAILVSERLVKEGLYTSVHIEEFEVEIRETKLGREEFTRDIPNMSEKALRNLDDEGIVRIGTTVSPGDILVGKVAPKSKTELSPEEKLLHAIFGRAGEDVKNDSLEVPPSVEGIVIDTQKFSRRAHLPEEQRKKDREELRKGQKAFDRRIADQFISMIAEMEEVVSGRLVNEQTGEIYSRLDRRPEDEVVEMEELFDVESIAVRDSRARAKLRKIYQSHISRLDQLKDEKERRLNHLKRGDELPTGVLELVKIYVATTRTLSVGDKVAGRHGNKGVIARIMAQEDMPFLEDGTSVDMVLNPLGVPSRMNVGQILETHLGWAAQKMGYRVITPVFDGASEHEIHAALKEAGLPEDGKTVLFDGRTGEPFDQRVTVGYMYMMKLDHLVDDKVHARATGPYSLITQQPLGGKARFGGQRFGEMEVWALEAYGAAHILQELLTVKSDDVEGRTKIYESMVKGENTLVAGTPVSFEVLMNEIKGLALDMRLERRKPSVEKVLGI